MSLNAGLNLSMPMIPGLKKPAMENTLPLTLEAAPKAPKLEAEAKAPKMEGCCKLDLMA